MTTESFKNDVKTLPRTNDPGYEEQATIFSLMFTLFRSRITVRFRRLDIVCESAVKEPVSQSDRAKVMCLVGKWLCTRILPVSLVSIHYPVTRVQVERQ